MEKATEMTGAIRAGLLLPLRFIAFP